MTESEDSVGGSTPQDQSGPSLADVLAGAKARVGNLPPRPHGMPKVDVDAIKQLDCRDVADRLGLVDQLGKRWRWRGYDGSAWIDFHADGAWYDHKHNQGGDAISLVQSWLGGAPDFEIKQANFWAACERIASAYGLWQTMAPVRERAEALAAWSEIPRQTPHEAMHQLVAAIEAGTPPPAQWAEAVRLWTALGVDPDEVTLCPDVEGTGALCWQPASPWQGVRISRKESGGYGGWTRARAQEWMTRGGLELMVLDLDGTKEPKLAPRADLVERLARGLADAGLPCAALVWSSVGAGDDRSKAHLYFRATRAAASLDEWLTWWRAIHDTALAVLSRINAPQEEINALAPDTSSGYLHRLVRLPGFAKGGAKAAALVARAEGTRVDVAGWLETRPIVFGWGDKIDYQLGAGRCVQIEDQGEDKSPKVTVIAHDLWPVSLYRTPSGDDGVRYRYHTRCGQVRYAQMPRNAWVSASGAKKGAEAAAAHGVQVGVGSEGRLSMALGRWLQAHPQAPTVTSVEAPGWHADCKVYVNGPNVHGGAGWVAATDGAELRGARRGTVEAWQAAAARLVTTPGLLTALAVSFAGALVQPLGRASFGLHLAARTTAGKSTALKMAAGIWVADYERFNATPKSLERRALLYSGACYCIDELGQSGLQGSDLGQLVYNLLSGEERGRLSKDATLREQGRWSLSLLTTGEVSVRQLLGDAALGGHLVRWIDLPLEVGEVTTSALHADELEELSRRCYGAVGDAWVAWLVGQDHEALATRYSTMRARWREACQAGDELGRVLDHLAVCGLALELAQDAGLVPWIDEQMWGEWALWLMARVRGTRAAEDVPESRAWARILRDIQLTPALYPTERGDAQTARELRGVIDADGEVLHTSRALLEPACAAAGTTADALLAWLVGRGLTDAAARKGRYAGLQRRWISIRLDDMEGVPGCDGGGTPPVPAFGGLDMRR